MAQILEANLISSFLPAFSVSFRMSQHHRRQYTPLFEDDTPRVSKSSQGGFFDSAWRRTQNWWYNREQRSAEKQIAQLQEQVDAIVSTKEVSEVTHEERVVLSDFLALNQIAHTLRRRKFMADASTHVNAQAESLPTSWEKLEEQLKHDVQTRQESRYPGGDRARLWSQEARFRVAEEYSLETQRMTLTEQSLDTSKVGSVSPRNHYLEPGMPPSYQARAALAMKNEGRVQDKSMEARMRSLMDRADAEVPLSTALKRQSNRTERARNHALASFLNSRSFSTAGARGYCTQTPREVKKDEVKDAATTSTTESPTPASTDSIISRFRAWFAKNGPLGVVLYLGYSSIDLTLLYLLMSAGVDLSPVLSFFGFEKGAGAATFAVAYAVHKMLAPARAALVMWTIPKVKPYWDVFISGVEKYAIQNDAKIQKFSNRFDRKP